MPEETRSCFACIHYDEPASTCRVFDERIDSELFAAKECGAYETEPADG